MPIRYVKGDMLAVKTEAMVNTVNCVARGFIRSPMADVPGTALRVNGGMAML